MSRWYCALISTLLSAAALSGADPSAPPDSPASEVGAGLFQVVKCFDFDERPLGNYEEVPMYWERLVGDGFPRYTSGRFDDQDGHDAPPSFVFEVNGGSVAYEYRDADLPVVLGADYLVVGYIRARSLHYAQAFVHACLVDATGGHVGGSDRVTRLVTSDGSAGGDEPWQRVELTISGDYPTATALRLGLYVLQGELWNPPSPAHLDPIIRQEVDATVWFDDITVYQLPRVRLALSDPAGLVRPGETVRVVCDLRNASTAPLTTELRITDVEGQQVHREQYDVPGESVRPLEIPLPSLDPGLYEAELYLRRDETALLCRTVRFAVLPDLPAKPRASADLGVDVGLWRMAGVEGLDELVHELRCGAVKLGVPMLDELDTPSKVAYVDQVRDVFRTLVAGYVDVAGVLLPPEAASQQLDTRATYPYLTSVTGFQQHLAPMMAYLGGLVTTWQLGAETTDAAWADAWDGPTLTTLRGHLQRFVTAAELVIPATVTALKPAETPMATGGSRTVSIAVPSEWPTRSLPAQLAALAGVSPDTAPDTLGLGPVGLPTVWLLLDQPRAELAYDQRILEGARRLVLAKALGAERVFVPAPFEISGGGGSLAWQPTEAYIALRTLFHYIGGKQAVAAMPLPDQDGLAVFFSDELSSCVVLWTWRAEVQTAPVELYLGDAPVAVDLTGRRVPLEVREHRAQVHLSPEPFIIEQIDAPLALLQASFRVRPDWLQLHVAEPRPVLHLRNYYSERLRGTATCSLPPDWRLEPRDVHFDLAPEEELTHPLDLELPPREIAMERLLGVQVELRSPVGVVLELAAPLSVRIRDIDVQTRARWDGDDLIVDQSLANTSAVTVSFSAFCQAPGRAQLEQTFLDVRPNERQTCRYVLPRARKLAGGVLRVGVREIRGPRSLDQLVEIPT
ncbi:MAG: hypothetical protein PVJ57_04730 [Phycisphaerae bacterium]|jgi:hypothetical protein